LAPRHLTAGKEGVAVLEPAELARDEAVGLQVVRVGRHVHRGGKAGMRDGAVVALQEVLAGDLPVGCELQLRAEAEPKRVYVDEFGELRRNVAQCLGERRRVGVGIHEDERPPRFHLDADEAELLGREAGLAVGARRSA
jgi:hypothetical protein